MSLNGIGILGEILQDTEKTLQLQSINVIRSIMGHSGGMIAVLEVRTCLSLTSIRFSHFIDIYLPSHPIFFSCSLVYFAIQARK